MMIDQNFLYAVVSLPAGVFNPYSNVKTSILLMDRVLAKKTKDILFIKVENDGFDLGAQRRPIDKNDLPQATEILKRYKLCLQSGKQFELSDEEKKIANLVPIEKVSKTGDYNLSGDRYKENNISVNTQWPMVELGNVVDILDSMRKPVTKGDRKSGPYPYYGSTGILDYVDDYIFDERLVLVGEDGAKWDSGENTSFIAEGKYWVNNHAHVMRCHKDKIIDTYLVNVLNEMDLSSYITGVTVPKLNQEKLRSIQIPLPHLEIQQEIVSQLESYQKIIDGAKQVVNNYKPEIKIDPSWEITELGEVADVIAGQSPEGKYYNDNGEGTPFYQGKTEFGDIYLGEPQKWTTQITKIAEAGDILMSVRAPVGPVNITTKKICIGRGLAGIRVKNIEKMFLFTYLRMVEKEIVGNGGAVFDSISKNQIEKINIPIPPLNIQKQIVSRIEEEQKIVDANKRLIELYQGKIKDKIDEVWGK